MTQSSPTSTREWNSSEYHRLSGPQVSWGKKVLSRLQLRGDELLLDAGCGTGRLTADLLQALPNGRVVALDVSQNMLRSAREYLQPQFGKRAQVVAADLPDLPFENASAPEAGCRRSVAAARISRTCENGWPPSPLLLDTLRIWEVSRRRGFFRTPKALPTRFGAQASWRSRPVLNRRLRLWKVGGTMRNS